MKSLVKKSSIDSPLLDIDEKGYVKVAFNKVGVKDHDGDVIVESAYKKTLSESSNLVYHLTDHNWKFVNSFIARPESLYLKNEYLVGESKIDLKGNPHGAYMHARYMEGDVKNHSIGFYTVKQNKQKDYNEITELHLLEGSAVLWGANPDTPTLEAKSMSIEQRDQLLSFLLKELDDAGNDFKKYLKTGLTTEETLFFGRRLESIKSEIKQLTQPLKNTEPKIDEEAKSIISNIKFY